MTSLESSAVVYRGNRTEADADVDPELGEDDELLAPHPHPHFSQRAPWLRAGVLGVRFHLSRLCLSSQLATCMSSKSLPKHPAILPSMHAVSACAHQGANGCTHVVTLFSTCGLQASDGLVSVASLMLGDVLLMYCPVPSPDIMRKAGVCEQNTMLMRHIA